MNEINKDSNEWKEKVKILMDMLGLSYYVIEELLILAGGDDGLVAFCVPGNHGLDQTKIDIINRRFDKMESKISKLEKRLGYE